MALYWNVIFHLDSIDTLSFYIRIAKLGLLGCYFYLSPTEPFVKLKKIKTNQNRLGLSKSYNSERSQRSLKDSDRFG